MTTQSPGRRDDARRANALASRTPRGAASPDPSPRRPEPAPVRDALLNTPDAAAYLSTTPSHVKRLRLSGRLKPTYVGKFVRFKRSELNRFIAEGDAPQNPPTP